MRKVTTLFILFFVVSPGLRAVAQSYFTSLEVGFSVGGSQYFGDLNDSRSFKTIGIAGGIYARRHLNPYISVKGLVNFTQVGFDDKYNTSLYQKDRNLNFKSDIYEAAFQAEFNFFKFVTGDQSYRFTPYLTGGIGAFMYDPYTIYQGNKVYLRPLGTEGQFNGSANRKYTNYSMCFPIGAGFKFWLVGGVNLTIEIADRLTRTDYLDDVSTTYVGSSRFNKNPTAKALQDRSIEINPQDALGQPGKQRGNTASFDQYMMGIVSISWHFKTYQCPSFMTEDLIRVK